MEVKVAVTLLLQGEEDNSVEHIFLNRLLNMFNVAMSLNNWSGSMNLVKTELFILRTVPFITDYFITLIKYYIAINAKSRI